MKTVSAGAEFFKFENIGDTLRGILGQPVKHEKDSDPNKDGVVEHKAGDIMGYLCEQSNGEFTILGNSAIIEKHVNNGDIKAGDILQVCYKGKGLTSKNKPVNMFKIDVLDDVDEWAKIEGRKLPVENPDTDK